ncbi:hypothetical protein [Paenibacillus donghaensis]|uniref:Nucleotide pyrophosphohydrolase n=1 Tax=Paenibacillus donghaensis TaxID=414771 RepID=A0A2Z2KH85_9BACL|nr:hypothetical protein [Paenibacillus donghaensis]ASA22603.1 hypothetical protein B9T62_18525 [Paenibacillus donghaensis]
MNINNLVSDAHQNAIDHGWWENPKSFGELISLMHSELSEAIEDHRNGKEYDNVFYVDEKPCGIPIEFADVIIRIFDACGYYKIDLESAIEEKMKYNLSRPYKHGNKKM